MSRELEAGTRKWEQQVLSMMHTVGGILDHWNPELQKIDRNLRLMQASEKAVCAGVKPGYYHLVRLRDSAEGTFMWVQPLQGPQGQFIEPNSVMLDALRMCDLQNERAVAERRHRAEAEAASIERAAAAMAQARVEEGVERHKAATRTQIRMNPGEGWAQNSAGTKRPTRSK